MNTNKTFDRIVTVYMKSEKYQKLIELLKDEEKNVSQWFREQVDNYLSSKNIGQ